MTINPFIPIPAMAIICVVLLACKRKGIWPYIRQIVMVLLLFAINLRIMVPNDEMRIKTYEMKANVIFVVDATISMLANDCEEDTRLEAAYKDCEYIIDHMTGARFSVISFHNLSQILCPFNDDVTFIKSTIRSIYPLNEYNARGTDLSICKKDLETELKSAEANGAYTVVFFISDGEDNKSEEVYNFKELAKYIDDGAVLGYGTEKGGTMTIRNYYYGDDEPEYTTLQHYVSGQGYVDAVSKMNPDNLKGIADGLGVAYMHMDKNTEIDGLLNKIMDSVDVGMQEKIEPGYDETFHFFAIGLLVMVLLECFFTKKQLTEKRI